MTGILSVSAYQLYAIGVGDSTALSKPAPPAAGLMERPRGTGRWSICIDHAGLTGWESTRPKMTTRLGASLYPSASPTYLRYRNNVAREMANSSMRILIGAPRARLARSAAI
jgi:hypothetical protein